MKTALCPMPLLLLLLALACAPEDHSALQRRPISPSPTNGWARVPLDAGAQRQLEGAWIGDGGGRSVPFTLVREGLWETRSLPLEYLLTGRDPKGRPTVEFSLRLPEGWQVGERETLRLDLDLEGEVPWVVQARTERQHTGGAFIAYEPPEPFHLYDLGTAGSRTTLPVPWDGDRYRLTLLATQGTAPRIRGLRILAETRPEALEAELAVDTALAPEPGQPQTWRLSLPETQRIVGLDLVLTPPAAPIQPEIQFAEGPEPGRAWFCQDLVWNLPALGSRASRLSLQPALARSFKLRLPKGATPQSARILVRRQTLLFPVEAGQAYALHLGGEAKPAPGNLGALPSLRSLVRSAPLSLGSPEPDPQGLLRPVRADERARPWMPWIACLGVLLLGVVAWRLFRQPEGPGA
jgi:hypothetical protein